MTSPYGVSLWRYIRSGWLNFSKFLVYDVGDGTRVKFWKHVWCGDCTLQEAFPKLYHLSRSKDSSVAEVMGWSAGRFNWNVQFLRPPQDWGEEALTGLWNWSILRQCGGLAQIRFVGSLQEIEVLRLEVIIALSILLILFPFHGK